MGVAKNRVAKRWDGLRREKRQSEADARYVRQQLAVQRLLSDPEEITLRELEGASIRKAIESLPEPNHRKILLLDLAGRQVPEMAIQLGIGTEAVKSRLRRARGALGRLLESCAMDLDGSGSP